MLAVNPYDITTYLACPRRAQAQLDQPRTVVDTGTALVADTIKWAYSSQSGLGHTPSWLEVRREAERRLVDHIDYKGSVQLLTVLSDWYDHYLERNYDGLPNLPVRLRLDRIVEVADVVPLVLLNKQQVTLCDFRAGTTLYSPLAIYKDMLAQIRIWGFWKASGTMPATYLRYVITPTTLKPVELTVLPHVVTDKVEPILRHVLRGMRDNIWYPAVSSQCHECPFEANCSI